MELCNVSKKRSIADILEKLHVQGAELVAEYKSRGISFKDYFNTAEIINLSKDTFISVLERFIENEVNELQEEGNLALDYAEQEGNYHIVSYWLEGTYTNIEAFLNRELKNYDIAEIEGIIIEKYPNDISVFEKKMINKYGENYTKISYIKEIIASILLNEFQHYPQWYTVYGTEEIDYIDFGKYSIINALNDKEEFPVMKMEDVVAAMYGINTTVQPSDMYDVFAHYADELSNKKEEIVLLEEKKESIFTPDPFMVLGVNARWKNYSTEKQKLKNKVSTDFIIQFNNIMNIEDEELRNTTILAYAINEYLDKYSSAPKSLPMDYRMVRGHYNDDDYVIDYYIRGIKDKKVYWDHIYSNNYKVPSNEIEYQELIFNIANDFKRELMGMEKERNVDVAAIEGKYPNRKSASHGLNFIEDLNVQFKNSRGLIEKKPSKPRFSLSMAEKQSLYFIKKMLRYTKNNPVLSTSFGIDSTVTQHLLRRVAKYSYYVVNNDSRVEYPELSKFRKRMIKEWDIENRITITKPVYSYWELVDKNGWNWRKKGDRTMNKNGKKVSPSEECCKWIKHVPMYNYIDNCIEKGNAVESIFTGLRAGESRSRMQQAKRDNSIYYAISWKAIRVNPISFFTDEYIWDYVHKYNVPYCDVYDKVLYYEDVFSDVSDEEIGKVYYKPRIGCWPCMISGKINNGSYIKFLQKFFPSQYEYIMFKRGMAKELFVEGAKKLGILSNIEIVKEEKKNSQISLFDTEDTSSSNKTQVSSEDILSRYTLEDMEQLIMKRPCKFLS